MPLCRIALRFFAPKVAKTRAFQGAIEQTRRSIFGGTVLNESSIARWCLFDILRQRALMASSREESRIKKRLARVMGLMQRVYLSTYPADESAGRFPTMNRSIRLTPEPTARRASQSGMVRNSARSSSSRGYTNRSIPRKCLPGESQKKNPHRHDVCAGSVRQSVNISWWIDVLRSKIAYLLPLVRCGSGRSEASSDDAEWGRETGF
jgi:hypothetical protein